MPAYYKVTMLIQLSTNLTGTAANRRIAGWSESVYSSRLASFLELDALASARMQVAPAGVSIVGMRQQQINPVGSSQTYGIGRPGAFLTDSDVPQMALLVRTASATSNNVRRWTIRGIPDEMVFQGEYKPTSAYLGRIAGYYNYLTTAQWAFPGRDLTVRPSPITTITTAGLVTMPVAFVANPGERVRITRTITAFAGLKSGTFKVESQPSPTTFKLANWIGLDAAAGTGLNLEARQVFLMGLSASQKVVTRKVGRPFDLYRGRASATR
jgi:hypothetical protein